MDLSLLSMSSCRTLVQQPDRLLSAFVALLLLSWLLLHVYAGLELFMVFSFSTHLGPGRQGQGSLDSQHQAEEEPSPTVTCTNNSVRVQHLRDYCKTQQNASVSFPERYHVTPDNVHLYHSLLADDVHRVLYCVIPKSGCTSLKSMLLRSAINESFIDNMLFRPMQKKNKFSVHMPHFLRKYGFRYLQPEQMPLKAIEERLNTYYKFIVVRHPFTRLLSAFNNKFVQSIEFPGLLDAIARESQNITDTQESNKIEKNVIKTKAVTFSNFANYLAAHERNKDQHWNTYENLCHPCHIRYDYIARLESLEQDLHFLSSKYNWRLNLEHLNPSKVSKGRKVGLATTDDLKALNKDTYSQLYQRYKEDMDMFGYDFDDERNPVCGKGEHCC